MKKSPVLCRSEFMLAALCVVIYLVAQIGRHNYSASTTLVMEKFGIDHGPAGLPSTAFFFAYGMGQIVVALLCGKFNTRVMVAGALAVSGLCNLGVFLTDSFELVIGLWLINGMSQAVLWPTLLLVLRRNVSVKGIVAAGAAMSMSSTGGRVTCIGLCALFAINKETFTFVFLLASVALLLLATVWFFLSGKFATANGSEKAVTEESAAKESGDESAAEKKTGGLFMLILFMEFSLAAYAVLGGLELWVPSIMKDEFAISDSSAIFMSVLLPLVTMSCAVVSPLLYKIFKNYVLICLTTFAVSGAVLMAMLAFIDVHWAPLLISFVVEALLLGMVTNSMTVQVPLELKGRWNAGFLAGILNGCCYIGSALSSYVLGALADVSGWTGAFFTLGAIIAVSIVFAAVYMLWSKKKGVKVV